ncbi:hypothetical protein [Halovenus sp. HT40]|uniref:hypothetical protein n=1 Tax=Halovenus sp. HT40 TaxID=3126691 RepID=UPI00300F56F3
MSSDGPGNRQRDRSDQRANQPRGGQPSNQSRGGQQPRGAQQQPRQSRQPQRGPSRGQQQNTSSVDFSTLPWISGAINGVAYFISSYLVLGLIFIGDFFYSLGDTFEPNADFFIYGVGWKIYDSYLVAVPENFSVLSEEFLVPSIAYTLLAGFFLFLAGRSVARTNGTFETPNVQMALYGATVAVGYAIAAAIGAIALEHNGTSPDLIESIVLIGLVFPAVFGGLGGYLAKR